MLDKWRRSIGASLLKFMGMQKSIPVIARMSDSDWTFMGTQRRTLTQLIGAPSCPDPYAVNAWVHGAIESVAQNVASTPIVWKNSQGKLADVNRAPVSQWIKLLERPGPMMGQQQLLEATMTYLLHFGECLWILDRDNPTDIPREITPYNGQIFDAVKNNQGAIVGWKVETVREDGKQELLKFASWEVCFFKLFNPYDPLRGLSPLAAAQLGIDQDFLASQYNKAFFVNSAMPGGVIEVEEGLTDEQFSRLRDQYQQNHQGVSRAHMLAILEGGAKYKQLMVSQKDMEFLLQKQWNRDEILACFKVPKLELGVWEKVNFAVAKVQAREFWVKSLMPKMRMLEFVLWSQLFSVTGTGNIFADFDFSRIEALQGDLNEKIDMTFKLWQMGYPINDLNERFNLGLPKKKWGDQPYVINNANMIDETGKVILPAFPAGTPPQAQGGEPSSGGAPKAKKELTTQNYLHSEEEPANLEDVDEFLNRLLEQT